jgi:lipooligosaccharide transport system ATP-binding protein
MGPPPFSGTSDHAACILEASGLVKHFGGRRVVDGVSLRCRAGEVLGLLGANGAGKTTTLRMCYGFLQPEAGAIRIAGIDRIAEPDRASRQVGVCTQDDTLDTDFTVRGNLLRMARYFRPRPEAVEARVDGLLDRFDLRRFADAKPDTLSGGYRRRLMIARALVHEPRLLFLDEPTTGLDPQARVAVWELMDGLRREGLGVVLTTHYMDEAERLSDNLLVLREGRVVAEGAPRTVLGDLIGEHMVVLDGQDPGAAEVGEWVRQEGLADPARVLGTWHVGLDGPGLARFTARFPALRFEVRSPTLDDLFLRLADRP